MSAATLTAGRVTAESRTQERVVTGLFFASLFVATFEKVHWSVRRRRSGSTTSRRSCS